MKHPENRPPHPGLLIAFLAAATLGPGIAAQDESCADCHDVAPAPLSVHADFGCTDCHMDVDEASHPGETTPDEEICSTCHDAADVLAETVHAEASCQGCHGGAHEILAASERDSTLAPFNQVVTCGDACHGPERHRVIDGYLTSVHGHALFDSGLVSAPSCTSCHDGHGMLPASDPRSPLSRERGPETCGVCHLYVLETWKASSAHGRAWLEGDDSGPVCVTCHGAHMGHDVARPTDREARLSTPENCAECHPGPYESYRDSFHGKVTELGFVTSAVCSDCHTPHGNLAAADPRSSVHPEQLAATCGACHDETSALPLSAAALSFDPHSDPSAPEAGPVHIIWLFMTTLLISVFTFFGVHDLLWLQRIIVGWRRKEWRRPPDLDVILNEPWVRRFSKFHIRTHALVIMSFLVLAATGLPLKFHDTAWAQALTAFPGSVALFRLLHRAAAVVTLGYAVLHAGYLLYRGAVKGDAGLFWGWRSMVPRRKDLEDLWHNLRFFVYREPGLRLDRWTYWEKFDYFAVFWGVPIIGLSGLMLWLPGFFTRFLPGWTLNAAFVIHSDEALLATGFIFVFHFFHTHLRPEIFPYDPVMFIGSMPLSRFKEERALEYERLEAAGELEERLVDAPSSDRLLLFFARGLFAVSIGLLLALAIFWSLLAH